MKRWARLVPSAAVLLAVAASTPGSTPAGVFAEPAEGDELEQIEQEVDDIRSRIADLNRRLDKLGLDKRYSLEVLPSESLQRYLERLVPDRLPLAPQPRKVPEGWTPYEYEGGIYYFIPADAAAAGPA